MTPLASDGDDIEGALLMAKFDRAIAVILAHEGGYVNDPDDPGGETNYGISKRSYPQEDIVRLTVGRATEIYRKDFWDAQWNGLGSQELATALLDASVNMGRSQAVKLLQRAINGAGGAVQVDGIFGSNTLLMANTYAEDVLREFRAHRTLFYLDLAWTQPTMKKFLPGWIRRAVV